MLVTWIESLTRTADPMKPPLFLKFRCATAFITFVVSLSVFVDIFLYAVIVPVIPFALHERVDISEDDLYGGSLLVSAPFFGWLSDFVHLRRTPYLIGVVCLAGATVFLCVGKTLPLLVVGRVLQGFSAAIVWTAGLALLIDTVGQGQAFGMAIGYVAVGLSLGYLIAPILGGIVFDKAGYFAVFYMCFGLLAFDIVCRFIVIERKVAKIWIPELDSNNQTPQATTRINTPRRLSEDGIGLTPPATASTIEVKGTRTSQSSIPSAIEVSTAVANATTPKLRRIPPVIRLLASSRMLAALWGTFAQASIVTAFESALPLRLQEVFGWNSLGSGLIFLAIALPAFLSSIIGKLSDRYGPKWFAAGGFIIAIPFLVLLRFVDHNTFAEKALLTVLLVGVGISVATALTPLMAEIAYSVETSERNLPPGTFGKNGAYAQGYALFDMAYASGTLVGPIWGGLIKEAAGWSTMVWTLGLLSFAAVVPLALYTGGWIGDAKSWKGVEVTSPNQSRSSSFAVDAEGGADVELGSRTTVCLDESGGFKEVAVHQSV